ncbi:MAG: hypothetical protein QM699_10455 [Amaricoccus sp.]|uniref:hypothetical protein n=1 Tax=Amaricoccus sp. TaxID=1872485 RepID=UPI0039E37E6C
MAYYDGSSAVITGTTDADIADLTATVPIRSTPLILTLARTICISGMGFSPFILPTDHFVAGLV